MFILNEYLKLFESSDKSIVDKNYISKGNKKLSTFKKINIHDDNIYNYINNNDDLKSQIIKILKYNGDGFIYIDKNNSNKLVAYILTCDGFICPIHVCNDYRGYNLSRQILKYAIKNLNVKYLWCATDNEIALKLYKSEGFKIDYKESDNEYYKMYLEK